MPPACDPEGSLLDVRAAELLVAEEVAASDVGAEDAVVDGIEAATPVPPDVAAQPAETTHMRATTTLARR